jgi:hypothetical protein
VEKLNLNDDTDDRRPGYRISRNCGSCKFFIYTRGRERRGACLHANVLPTNITKIIRGSRSFLGYVDAKGVKHKHSRDTRKHFTPTHINCVCDLHTYRSNSEKKITRYCGAKIKEGYDTYL